MEEYKLNRLETTKLMGPIVDKHWEELRTAKDRGQMVGWSSVVMDTCCCPELSGNVLRSFTVMSTGPSSV